MFLVTWFDMTLYVMFAFTFALVTFVLGVTLTNHRYIDKANARVERALEIQRRMRRNYMNDPDATQMLTVVPTEEHHYRAHA